MIVGSGLLARAFEPLFGLDSDVTVFASGVSNSLESDPSEFARERALLAELLGRQTRRFIYFGSCGVATGEAGSTPYMKHKQAMEQLVLSVHGGLVFRLPQVVGVTRNTHTLTNFLRDRIISDTHFTIWSQAERNLIDVEDIALIAGKLARQGGDIPGTISIAAKKSMLVADIVNIFERTLGKKANYSLVEKGDSMNIDTSIAAEAGTKLGIDLGDGYIERVIKKYYGSL